MPVAACRTSKNAGKLLLSIAVYESMVVAGESAVARAGRPLCKGAGQF